MRCDSRIKRRLDQGLVPQIFGIFRAAGVEFGVGSWPPSRVTVASEDVPEPLRQGMDPFFVDDFDWDEWRWDEAERKDAEREEAESSNQGSAQRPVGAHGVPVEVGYQDEAIVGACHVRWFRR